MTVMRLQKYLSVSGVCSRRKGEELITQGRVTVNGTAVTEQGVRIDDMKDRVAVDGKPVGSRDRTIYIALNKPVNVESTCRKGRGAIVLDLVDVHERVFPVGRLDKDSEGLILLTNDGRIHHTLSHPSFQHEKEYVVTVNRSISDADLTTMSRGMNLGDCRTRPCRISRTGDVSYRIILKEGKNRQIRRMAAAVGYDVVTLKRVRIIHVRLGNLAPGAWRHLTAREVDELLKTLGILGS